MSHGDITVFFLAVAILLGTARLLGELMQRWGQPSVLGEILAGVLLGPTLLGRLAPEFQTAIFPAAGPVNTAMQGLTVLAVTLFLLVAGMEIDLKATRRQGGAALIVSAGGMVVPFALGYLTAWYLPTVMGAEPDANRFAFALFMGTALSISALPVIAKTLMDLGLYRTDFGVVVMAAGLVNDLVGWLIFALLLGMIGQASNDMPFAGTVAGILLFSAFMLTAGRRFFDRILPWIKANTTWPGGVLGLALTLTLLSAAFTEWLGVHAVFGAFLVGIALGDSQHLEQRTRRTIEQFVSFVFVPLFFAGIGLHVDFVQGFDLGLCLVVLAIATVGKLVGSVVGGRLGGFSLRESTAIGFGMNARGAMEIILGLLALEAGVIGERLFVALVIMALATSLFSGPAMQRILRRKRPIRFQDFLPEPAFAGYLTAQTRYEAIVELAQAVATAKGLEPQLVIDTIWSKEQVMPTGLMHRVAVPNARIAGLKEPVVALGFSRAAIDFSAPDGQTAQIIALVLFPEGGTDSQWAIIGDVARTFANAHTREWALRVTNFTELRALLRVAADPDDEAGHGENVRPRHGYVVVGARPIALELARRMTEAGTDIWLVDTNRNRVDAALAEGLSSVLGNAQRDVTLLKAHAFEAEAILALTPNPQVNEEIVRFAKTEFAIPAGGAAGSEIGELSQPLLRQDVLSQWDTICVSGRNQWLRLNIETEGILDEQLLTTLTNGRELLPLVVERQGRGLLATLGMTVQVGDVLGAVVVGAAARADAWMLDSIDRAPVVEFDAIVPPDEYFGKIAEVLAGRLHKDSAEIKRGFIDHESFHPTILTAALGVPHMVLGGSGIFELILCRSSGGIRLSGQANAVPLAIALVTSRDERPKYLKFLAALAEVAQDKATLADWQVAGAGEAFREAVRIAFAARDAG